MKKVTAALLALLLCLALCACGGETDPDLYGTWDCQTFIGTTYTFQKNGTVQMDGMARDYTADGELLVISTGSDKHGIADLRFRYRVGRLTENPEQEVLVLEERELEGSAGTTLIFYKR